VRYEGFIPWDDDVDIMMLRSELDKLLDVIDEELPSNRAFVSWEKTLIYKNTFPKYFETDTLVVITNNMKNDGLDITYSHGYDILI
jgi:lipopolysaccharide cholinephosphotransferase